RATRRRARTVAAASARRHGRSARGGGAPRRRPPGDSSSRSHFLRHALGVSGRAHLGVEAVGFVELALTGPVVAEETGELRRDLVDDGRSRARSRLVDQRGRFGEGVFYLGGATRIPGAEEGSGARQERVHLEEAVATLPRFGQGLIGQVQRGPRIAL